MNFYTLYRCHDYHFTIYAAMFLGQQRTALNAVAGLEATIPDELLQVQSPPMADWLEGFLAMRVHVLIRFGRWAEIMALPVPPDADLYCVSVAMRHYARGVAFSATGRVAEAEVERTAFQYAMPAGAGDPDDLQQHLPGHPRRRRRPCWTESWSTARAITTWRSPCWGEPWSWTITCPSTNRGPGCNRPAMRSARCCSSRAGSSRPRRCTGRTSA